MTTPQRSGGIRARMRRRSCADGLLGGLQREVDHAARGSRRDAGSRARAATVSLHLAAELRPVALHRQVLDRPDRDLPPRTPSQRSSAVGPCAVIAPRPVTTTRRGCLDVRTHSFLLRVRGARRARRSVLRGRARGRARAQARRLARFLRHPVDADAVGVEASRGSGSAAPRRRATASAATRGVERARARRRGGRLRPSRCSPRAPPLAPKTSRSARGLAGVARPRAAAVGGDVADAAPVVLPASLERARDARCRARVPPGSGVISAVRVVRAAEAGDLGVDRGRRGRARALALLEHQERRALAEHRAARGPRSYGRQARRRARCGWSACPGCRTSSCSTTRSASSKPPAMRHVGLAAADRAERAADRGRAASAVPGEVGVGALQPVRLRRCRTATRPAGPRRRRAGGSADGACSPSRPMSTLPSLVARDAATPRAVRRVRDLLVAADEQPGALAAVVRASSPASRTASVAPAIASWSLRVIMRSALRARRTASASKSRISAPSWSQRRRVVRRDRSDAAAALEQALPRSPRCRCRAA